MPSQPPSSVLIVEDEALIGLMLEDHLAHVGFEVVGVAASEAEAFRMAGAHKPGYAVVDINLGAGGSGLNVGLELNASGVLVLYASAYCPEHWEGMVETGARACMSKPYDAEAVPRALEALAMLRVGKLPRLALPSGLHFLD
jgi:ActR/RegA family two-component response regulator